MSESAMTLLPEPGPPLTTMTSLVFAPVGLVNSAHDERVRDLLLVEEHELLPALNLLGGERQ